MERKRNKVNSDSRLRVSAIVTSFREEKTIGKAVTAFINQSHPLDEIIVISPDEKTLKAAKKAAGKSKVIFLKDSGKGKPSALNHAISKASGDILILSDGDVQISSDSVEEIMNKFKEDIGAVSGRVISVNNKKNLFGFWAFLTTEMIHKSRMRSIDLCTGYLYGIRKSLYKNLPENTLADDAYVSLHIKELGYQIGYAPRAEVRVLYPDNLKDWIKQKKRTAGKFYQLSKVFKVTKQRELLKEVSLLFNSFLLIKNFRDLLFLLVLLPMRLYIWIRVFFDYRLWKRSFEKTWLRPHSTKKNF